MSASGCLHRAQLVAGSGKRFTVGNLDKVAAESLQVRTVSGGVLTCCSSNTADCQARSCTLSRRP